ncbi:MAG TPA: tRNA 2-thiouridine(34) synthase MnmA [Candidatus Saccharimonadales bacterium]|nr:tRNA 2-thiouridine(34) synthase MnmA [Candidatus Saccharimonadales bacterium]
MAQKKTVPNQNKRVLVALSGGVDSAVSAALLKDQGYTVEAGHMVCWDEGPYCSADADRASAAKVAAHLDIPFHVFDFRKEYRQEVIGYFYSEYEEGRTPNPDVACNREIKFGIFLQKALSLGYDYIATGHYARVEKVGDRYKLLAGVDPNKDQSYFLYNLNQEQLAHSLFPVGALLKTQVREIAEKYKLPNSAKKDSQGICFIGDVEISEFLREKIKPRFGEVVNPSGEVLGKHQGVAFYTIGQREGLGISKKVPHYVVAKQIKTNTIVAAPFNDESHFQKSLSGEKVNWVSSIPLEGEEVSVRSRYRQDLLSARIVEAEEKSLKLAFSEPQRGITSGQSVVLYKGEEVLGGGTII